MAGCKNCFNGCKEITSDKCVKYTGPSIPQLGIEDGEVYTLNGIQELIFNFLATLKDGSGIVPDITTENCSAVDITSPATLNELLDNINSLLCTFNDRINNNRYDLEILNEDFIPGCLNVDEDAGAHAVIQSLINGFCSLIPVVENIETSLGNYILITDVDEYIAAYISGTGINKMSAKMVPYAAIEYYGDLDGKFDINGVGLPNTEWENIYICNGKHGTPDKRGRIAVGAIAGLSGVALHPNVDPLSNPGNPNYALGNVKGSNSITLSAAQMPSHDHTATTTVNDSGHKHTVNVINKGGTHAHYDRNFLTPGAIDPDGPTGPSNPAAMNSALTGITVSTQIGTKGGGEPHSNIPPVIACYYIMYIP